MMQVEISFYLLRRLLGVKTQEGGKQAKVQKLQRQEILMVNIGSTASGGKVLAVKQVRRRFFGKMCVVGCAVVTWVGQSRTPSVFVLSRDRHLGLQGNA